MSKRLSERQEIALGWMVTVNGRGAGFLGPSLRRAGREPTCEECVAQGWAECRDTPGLTTDERGYWITAAGREVLATDANA